MFVFESRCLSSIGRMRIENFLGNSGVRWEVMDFALQSLYNRHWMRIDYGDWDTPCACPQNGCLVSGYSQGQILVRQWFDLAGWWHEKKYGNSNQWIGSCRCSWITGSGSTDFPNVIVRDTRRYEWMSRAIAVLHLNSFIFHVILQLVNLHPIIYCFSLSFFPLSEPCREVPIKTGTPWCKVNGCNDWSKLNWQGQSVSIIDWKMADAGQLIGSSKIWISH